MMARLRVPVNECHDLCQEVNRKLRRNDHSRAVETDSELWIGDPPCYDVRNGEANWGKDAEKHGDVSW